MERFLDSVGANIRALSGWRRMLFAFVAGLLSALSFAPFGLFPFLLLGFAALVLLVDGTMTETKPWRVAAFTGWAFGFGQFLAGLYWIGYAFLVDAADHAWQLPFVALIFPGGLALFTALACGVAGYLWREGAARIFILAVCYSAAEWLRGNILTGFPWNLPAYGWGASLAILQSVSVIGVYGLSLLTVLFGASLALLFTPSRRRNWHMPAALTLALVSSVIGPAEKSNVAPAAAVKALWPSPPALRLSVPLWAATVPLLFKVIPMVVLPVPPLFCTSPALLNTTVPPNGLSKSMSP